MKKIILLIFIYLFSSAILHALELKGSFFQGNMITGKTNPGTKIFIDKKKIKVSDKGFFVFGLSKNRKNDIVIEAVQDGTSVKIIKKILKKKIYYTKNQWPA